MAHTPLDDLLEDMYKPRPRWVGSGVFTERSHGPSIVTYFASGPDGRWWSHHQEDGQIIHLDGEYWEADTPFKWVRTRVEGGGGVYHDGMLMYFLQPSIEAPSFAKTLEPGARYHRSGKVARPVDLLEDNENAARVRFKQPPNSGKDDYVLTFDKREHVIRGIESADFQVGYRLNDLSSARPPEWIFRQHHYGR